MIRIQKNKILADLNKKIALLVGPRQAGKTWLAKDVSKSFSNSLYLNYDDTKDREKIHKQSWLESTDLLIFDELHKMPNWKTYLKGIYDTRPEHQKILVTGSARLEIYDKVGDSLAGRYFCHRLLPLSLAELKQTGETTNIDRLLERGGFPEPYFADDEIEASRWRMQYLNSLLSTDVFEIKTIHNLKGMRLVLEMLRERVGSPISYKAIAEEAQLSPPTVKEYIQILESIHVLFLVTPYSKNIAKSILKEPKVYFYDVGFVKGDIGAKLENFVAVSLLKSIYGRNDILAEDCRLHYLRTTDGKEVDFAIVKNNAIETMIEVKTSDDSVSKSLRYFYERHSHPAIQLVLSIRNEYQDKGIQVLRLDKYLSTLYL